MYRIKSVLFSIFFLGSVFITSEKFVDSSNSPKFYFTIIFLLAVISSIAIIKKQITFETIISNRILWCISGIFILQATYGICQHIGWFPSNHLNFTLTGSFDNPAGFAANLAIGFPINLLLLLKVRNIERYFIGAGVLIIAIAVFLSGSRTGLLAILISSISFFFIEFKTFRNIQKLKYFKPLSVFILVISVTGSLLLYRQKQQSANGRLLIWKVSCEMIKDEPVFGHGYGAFKAKYMDYQADYFKNHPNSKFALLADNVKHPFNEYIKIAVEFGIISLVTIVSLIMFLLWKIVKTKNQNRGLIFSGLVSLFLFAFFSYPLQYIAVWLLLSFYLLNAFPLKEIRLKNTPFSIFTRVVVVVISTFALLHFNLQMQTEIKWKIIAENSLYGKTQEMLPKYKLLYSTPLKQNPFFLYNYGAELNIAEKYGESINILKECESKFNDYDLQILLADNYYNIGSIDKATQTYVYASNMIPCRFLPIYQLFEIYRKTGQKDMAVKWAIEIVNKKVKIPSLTINSIKAEAEKYLKENEITFGNTW
jgi:O-antigen ligase